MAGYGVLLRRAPTWWWLVATVATRLAVCTVPLGAVFVAEAHTGSYAWGAVIAGAYAAGEAVAAPGMGARFQRLPLRRELSRVSAVEAGALVGVVVALSFGMPVVAVGLAAVAGGVASGTFGGLRTLLVHTVPDARESALALDVIVNQVCQIAGPALVAGAAVVGNADAPFLIVSGGLLVTLAVVGKLPESVGRGSTARPDGGSTLDVVRVIWPSMVVVTVVLMMQAVLEVTLPSVLEQRGGPPAWAGIALSGLAVTSIVGSFLYGLRRWAGRPLTHTVVLASVFALLVAAAGVVGSPAVTVVLVAGAGFFQAAASTARSLAVTDALPAHSWAVGFSVLYSCAAAGFTVASAVSALFLATSDAAVLLVLLGLVGCGVFVVTGWWERAAVR